MLSSSYVKLAQKWLKEKGQLADVDELLLEQLSDAIQIYNMFQKQLEEKGPTTTYSSGEALSPAYKGIEATSKRIIMLSDKLGLSPRARKGIKVEAVEEDEDSPLDDFLK